MNGITIQEQPCPRCAIPRTARRLDRSFCYNCHLQWDIRRPASVARSDAEVAGAISLPDIARLAIYREAVRAGFYNDR
jgi:ribosomal protein S27AE